ncbi:hypothetical protein CEXT_654301 [Caerostris extrusa]|uniref:Uncharacterized protein n=1 Tax=Caerostris extrusa TaxID=172846 RepID=A0AAV4XGT8_CAEEX|nr:hypothetical protein CEXT_654301 [Caerostris extrusa]
MLTRKALFWAQGGMQQPSIYISLLNTLFKTVVVKLYSSPIHGSPYVKLRRLHNFRSNAIPSALIAKNRLQRFLGWKTALAQKKFKVKNSTVKNEASLAQQTLEATIIYERIEKERFLFPFKNYSVLNLQSDQRKQHFVDTPQPEFKNIVDRRSFKPGCWKMMVNNSIIFEMALEQSHHWVFNGRRSAILHENDSIRTCMQLKCWNYLFAQKTLITFAIDGVAIYHFSFHNLGQCLEERSGSRLSTKCSMTNHCPLPCEREVLGQTCILLADQQAETREHGLFCMDRSQDIE